MRQGWFDRIVEMLHTVEESAKEQWNCSDVEDLFKEKVSTSYTIISAIGPSPQDGHRNRRSVSTHALVEFLHEFQTILESTPRPKAIEAARLLFRQKVKSSAHQETERTDKLDTVPTNPSLPGAPASEHLDAISKEHASAHSIMPVEVANQTLTDRLDEEEMTATKSFGYADCEDGVLRHANWECRYFIALVPKKRYMAHYAKHRHRLTGLFTELAKQKHCKAESGKYEPDHAYMIISVPPYVAVSSVAKHLKDGSSLRMMEVLGDLERYDDGHCFWARAYFAPLSKLDLDEVRQLMADRDRED